MQTIRTLLMAAIKHVLLVWGLIQLTLTWMIGSENSSQLIVRYSFGIALILLHFISKAYRTQVFKLS